MQLPKNDTFWITYLSIIGTVLLDLSGLRVRLIFKSLVGDVLDSEMPYSRSVSSLSDSTIAVKRMTLKESLYELVAKQSM